MRKDVDDWGKFYSMPPKWTKDSSPPSKAALCSAGSGANSPHGGVISLWKPWSSCRFCRFASISIELDFDRIRSIGSISREGTKQNEQAKGISKVKKLKNQVRLQENKIKNQLFSSYFLTLRAQPDES